jgi:hypothetical protein
MSGRVLNCIRRHVTVTAAAIGLGGAWGALGAFCGRFFFHLQEVPSLLFVGLPIGLLVVALMWKRLPQLLGFDE